MSSNHNPSKGDEYHHPTGAVEIVFATEAGRVLTVKEYPAVGRFADAVDAATYEGTDEAVATLPAVELFEVEGQQHDRSSDDSETEGSG